MDVKKNTNVALFLLCIGATLAFASPAAGAEDPVEKGTLRLKLSNGFADALESQGVKMTPTSFSIRDGSINPISGTGTVALKERLRFRTDARKLVFRKLNARLGDGGILKVGGVRMFRLEGGGVVRNGFGAQVKGVDATLTSKGARKLKRRLRLHSLSAMPAGEVSVSEQPETVEVTGGSIQLVPDPNLNEASGSVASLLDDHCVDFFDGNTAIPPGDKIPPREAPTYRFPVSGGTIGPQGTAGIVNQSGGLEIRNRRPSSMSNPCHTATLAVLDQTDFTYNLLDDYISSHVVVSEVDPGTVPSAGDQGTASGFDLDRSAATVAANPADHSVQIRGIVVRINKGAALTLNQTFPQGTYNGAREFNAGNLFGTLDLTVTTR